MRKNFQQLLKVLLTAGQINSEINCSVFNFCLGSRSHVDLMNGLFGSMCDLFILVASSSEG